jgi:hypothetical protein
MSDIFYSILIFHLKMSSNKSSDHQLSWTFFKKTYLKFVSSLNGTKSKQLQLPVAEKRLATVTFYPRFT